MPKNLFQKGHPFFKGGEKGWFKKGLTPWNKGTGRKGICPNCNKEFNATGGKNQAKKFCSRACWNVGHVPWNKGKSCPNRQGENAYQWKGGISVLPEYAVMLTQKRKALKKSNGGIYTLEQWSELKKKFNYMCLCCKQQEPFIKLSVDHIVPLSRGGSNNISNIQPLCKSCNSKKFTKTINYIDIWQNSI